MVNSLFRKYDEVPTDVKFILAQCNEKLNFASALREELKRNDASNTAFLCRLFYFMLNKQSNLVNYNLTISESEVVEQFFRKISRIDELIPCMVISTCPLLLI